MGMFDLNITESIDQELKHPERLMEAFIVDEISCLPEETIREFCEVGGVGEQLVQEGRLRKKTLVRLSKTDDLTRRNTMAELQLAKEAKDPLWKQLVINRQKKHKIMDAIHKKFGAKGKRVAAVAQKEYLKGGPKGKGILPKSFTKDGRVSTDV